MDRIYEEIFSTKDEKIANLGRKLRDLETSKSELSSKVKPRKVYTGSGPGERLCLRWMDELFIH